MEILNSILGVIGAIALLVLLVIAFYILKFWRKIKKGLKEISDSINTGNGVPQTLHLNESLDDSWLSAGKAEVWCAHLKELGFERGEGYDVVEMPDTQLQFFKRDESQIAVLYVHPIVGYWVEFLALLPDDKYLCVTNSNQQSFLRYPQWLEMHYESEEDLGSLYKIFESCLGNRTPQNIQGRDLREFYEENYKSLMAWRNQQGGTSFEEVQLQASKMEKPLTEEQLQEAFEAVKSGEFYSWEVAMHEELKALGISDDREQLFIVPDRSDCPAFFRYIEDYFHWTEKQQAGLLKIAENRMDSGMLFDAMNTRLSKDLRAKEKCRIEFPLAARVFIASEVEIHQMNTED